MDKVLYALVASAAIIIPKSCTISLGGGGGSGGGNNVSLAVPWVRQEYDLFCGPATVLMWTLYDGLGANLTQDDIARTIGATQQQGATPQGIAYGINYYARRSGSGASLDYAGGTNSQIGVYYSAEVTSANNLVPIAVLIGGATHVGMVAGGSWHVDDNTGLNVWDSVVFQDPIVGPGQPYVAGQWTSADIGHIISPSASASASANFDQYGGNVGLRGSGGRISRQPY